MIALFGIVVVSLVALTQVVASAAPLKLMNAVEPNFVPSTSSTKAPLLAITLGGFKLVMVGMVPGAGGVLEFEPYPPQPAARTQSNTAVSSFINPSKRHIYKQSRKWSRPRMSQICHFPVKGSWRVDQ